MLRGYNEKIFLAEIFGNTSRISQIEMGSDKPGQIVKNEIFQITGSKIAAFELDTQNIQEDSGDEHVK